MMDVTILGNNTIASNQSMNINWNSIAPQTEYDHVTEMQYNQYCYNETKDGVDNFTIRKEDKKELKNDENQVSQINIIADFIERVKKQNNGVFSKATLKTYTPENNFDKSYYFFYNDKFNEEN